MSDARADTAKVAVVSRSPLIGQVSTGLSLFALAATVTLAGAGLDWFGSAVGGKPNGRLVSGEVASIEDNASSALLPRGGATAARSPAVFSSAAPLLAVPVAVAGALSASGRVASSSIVRTVETAASDRIDVVVAPIKRMKPQTPGTAQVAASPVKTIDPVATVATPVGDRSTLAMQPYGLGAGNLARSAGAATEKTTAKAKVVCKSNQVFDKVKDVCAKRPR